MTAVLNQTAPVVYDRRIFDGERPDRDGKYDFPFRAVCVPKPNRSPLECQFQEVFLNSEAAYHALETHTCPLIYDPPRRYGVLSIAEQLWIELDHTVDSIMSMSGMPAADPDKLKLQGRAGGLAAAIVKMCQPYYADETAVSRQARKRWMERQGQTEWEPTPGFKYDPPIPSSVGRSSANRIDSTAPTYGQNELKRTMDKLGTTKVGQIKQALNSGMFKPKDLVSVYGVPVETLEAIAKS